MLLSFGKSLFSNTGFKPDGYRFGIITELVRSRDDVLLIIPIAEPGVKAA